MTGDDLSDQERELLEAAEQQPGRVGSTVDDGERDPYECEHCGAEHDTLTASRSHECPEQRAAEAASGEIEEREGIVGTQVHEFGAHLCFADDRDGMSPYYAVVGQFDAALHYEEDDEPFVEDVAGEDWLLNTDSVRYWSGGIAAEGESYETYNEYQVPLVADDDLSEKQTKKIQFQFRPALPEAKTPDGDRIESMPEDLPEGIRVQINSANVHPDDVTSILRKLMQRMDVQPTYFLDEKLYAPSCSVYNLARYVRLQRSVSEELITSENALLERIARFGSQNRGRGEYKWDNEEIMGHRTAVAMTTESWNKLLDGRRVGTLLKSYHMKSPEKSAGSETSHPKLEVQFSQEFSDGDLKYVPWSDDDYDVDDLLAELDETLINCLHWAGVNLQAEDPAYVSDQYFDAGPVVRSLELVDDPIDLVEDVEADYAAQQYHAADLTEAQERVLRTVADGGEKHYETVAEEADVGTSTVYRTMEKLAGIVELANGLLSMQDEVIRERVSGLLQTIDEAAEWANRELSELAAEAVDLDEDSPFASWLRRYGVQMREMRSEEAPVEGYCEEEWLELSINLGDWTEGEVRRMLREAGIAARQTSTSMLYQLRNTVVRWTDGDGQPQSVIAGSWFGSDFRVGGSSV